MQLAEIRYHRNRLAPIVVFMAALGLAIAFYGLVTVLDLREGMVHRYFFGHPIKVITTWLFFWGMAVLVAKSLRIPVERGALKRPILSEEMDAKDITIHIPDILGDLGKLPTRTRSTWFVQRLCEAITNVQVRGSADDLEERLNVLADRDADELDGSYELVRR